MSSESVPLETLDVATRDAIRADVRRYRRWLKLAGVTNVAILASAVLYAFFVVPGQAAREAVNLFRSQIEAAVTVQTASSTTAVDVVKALAGEAMKNTGTLQQEVGRTSERLDFLKTEIGRAERSLADTEKGIALLKQSDPGKVAEFLRQLSLLSPAEKENVDLILRIKRLEASQAHLRELVSQLGFLSKQTNKNILDYARANGANHVAVADAAASATKYAKEIQDAASEDRPFDHDRAK